MYLNLLQYGRIKTNRLTEGGGFVMAYDWKQWYGVDQNTYNKEKQRISQAITTYGAKGDLASIQKAQKHQQMFEQAYKGIDPNTGQKFSSSQNQPTLFSNQGQGSMPWVNPYADDLMGSFGPIDFSGAESAAKQTADYQYGRLQNQVDTAGQRLLDSYNSGLRRTEDDLNYAKGNLEKASHLDRLRAKESLVASGNADSSAGLADMDTRLALAKQDNLTDLTRGYQRQNEDLTDQYNSGQQALADQLAQFDYTKIYNDAFAPLQQAIMEAQQGKQKTLMELYKGAQDQYNEDRKYTDMTAYESAQMQQKAMDLLAPYMGMTQADQARYGPGGIEMQKIQSDLLRHYDPSGNAQLQAQSAANVANINGQYGLQRQQIASNATLAASQIAATARIEAAKISKVDPNKVISQSDLEIFLKNLVPGEDTRESAQAGIDQAYQSRQIDEASYKVMTQTNKAYWDNVAKEEQKIQQQNKQNFDSIAQMEPSEAFKNVINWLSNIGYNMGAGGTGNITSGGK